MTKREFAFFLKRNKLNIKDFANLCDIPYQTALGWNRENKEPPRWLKSWCELYEKAKKYDEMMLQLKQFKD